MKPSVVIVDPDRARGSALERHLRDRFAVRLAFGLDDALRLVASRAPDVIVCEERLGHARGTDLLHRVAVRHARVRRILTCDDVLVADARAATPAVDATWLRSEGVDSLVEAVTRVLG